MHQLNSHLLGLGSIDESRPDMWAWEPFNSCAKLGSAASSELNNSHGEYQEWLVECLKALSGP